MKQNLIPCMKKSKYTKLNIIKQKKKKTGQKKQNKQIENKTSKLDFKRRTRQAEKITHFSL